MNTYKSFITLIAVGLLFSCGQSPKQAEETPKEDVVAANSDWATANLLGKVKSYEEMNYTADSLGTIGEMDSCCAEIKVFDDKGYVGSYSEKNNEGIVVYESIWDRFEDGKWRSSSNTEDGEASGGRMVTQSEDGKILHAIDTEADGTVEYFYNEIKENELGQALEGKMYMADSTYMGTWSRKYIEGAYIGRGWIDSVGTVLNDSKGELNDKGWLSNMTVVKTDDEGTTTTEVFTYTYDSFDETGNWTQMTEMNEAGVTTEVKKRTYAYFE